MLRDLSAGQKAYLKIAKKSKTKCGGKLEAMRQLAYIIPCFHKSVEECCCPEGKKPLPKHFDSLVFACYLELVRIVGHTLFLSNCALYRNAFDNIRYSLESVVQALYIDLRHPQTPLQNKIEILREIEDKREYHTLRLIDELRIDHKDKLKAEYKELSRIIHPSHKQIMATWTDIMEGRGVPSTIDCEEVSRIYASMERMFDIFFFLFIVYFPEIVESLRKNPDVSKYVKDHNLVLLDFSLKPVRQQ